MAFIWLNCLDMNDDTLTIPDFLISDRLSIEGNKLRINYYSDIEVKFNIGFFKRLFTNICDVTNKKNKELYHHASQVAKDKRLQPPFPPLKYIGF